MKYMWNRDCREFKGVYPCDILKTEGYADCEGCKFYDPLKKRVLLVKIGALGDVVRTIPLVQGIREAYGEGVHVTWLVMPGGAELLRGVEGVDRVLEATPSNVDRVKVEEFDVLIALELDAPGSVIASQVNAKKRFGFFLDKDGHPSCFNKESEEYLELAISDKLKRENTKTYQEYMFRAAGLVYKKQGYELSVNDEEKEYARRVCAAQGLNTSKRVVGVNAFGGGRWVSKRWSEKRVVELVELIKKKDDDEVMLLGGKSEEKSVDKIVSILAKKGVRVYKNDANNTLREFLSVLDVCDVLVTVDTMALHLGVGLKKKVIALFNCTIPSEVEEYGLVKKIESKLLQENLYTDEYNEELMESISAQEVFDALKNV